MSLSFDRSALETSKPINQYDDVRERASHLVTQSFILRSMSSKLREEAAQLRRASRETRLSK